MRALGAVFVLAACCVAAAAAPFTPFATSADGRWRVEGVGPTVVVRDGGQTVKSIPARSLGGREDAAVTAVQYLSARRSFAIAFDTLPELWELSIDPAAPPIHDGLVHDWRLGEAIASPGFLGVRRTPLDAPVRALAADASGSAFLLARTADAWLLVNLDVRRTIARYERVQSD